MNKAILTGQSTEHLVWLNERLAIHQQAQLAWQAMQQHAAKDGVMLEIASGFRSFERQLTIWNNKLTGKTPIYRLDGSQYQLSSGNEQQAIFAVLLFSALPGASRHHWGTDVDLYAPNLLPNGQSLQLTSDEYHADGYFAPMVAWLEQHADSYDFFKPYDCYRQGVAAEPWHYSYAPIAYQYQQQLNYELLYDTLSASSICHKQQVLSELTTIYQQFIINIGAYPHD